MHVVFRESHGLEERETPRDLGQAPADLVVLSFSDSDLGAFAEGWRAWRDAAQATGAPPPPSLRLANLEALRHPLSVDAYAERTLAGAKAILLRILGGEGAWAYGLAQTREAARRSGAVFVALPGDGRPDPKLEAWSSLPTADLRLLAALCEGGGAEAARLALEALHGLTQGASAARAEPLALLPPSGWWDPDLGAAESLPPAEGPRAAVVFYRAHLAAADARPAAALIRALRARGFAAMGAFLPSLKEPQAAAWLRAELARMKPAVLLNATAFSAKGEDGTSPLEAAEAPALQVALSTADRDAWAGSTRGLSPPDLAMNLALPEIDGRIFAGVVSFKATEPRDADLQFARPLHEPDPERVAAVADKAAAWARLAATPDDEKRFAFVLSSYPGKPHQLAHAVGLDALASCEAMLAELGLAQAEGALGRELLAARIAWPLEAYRAALAHLPEALRRDLAEAWGAPEADPACAEGAFRFTALRRGKTIVAAQPERGESAAHKDSDYHDLSRVPRHGYVAFYLWLRAQGIHALIHIGAHGTLEWLPGKAAALSAECWPEALTGPTPVIYPFIVNDPGEAAQARRRLGAVTLGHLPPPLAEAATPEALRDLERLLDEYGAADGLDPGRRGRLIAAIRAEAQRLGIEEDLGVPPEAGAAEAVPRIDRFVCDLKESRYGEGLHIYGAGLCGAEERAGLKAALAGRRVAAGPSGSPARGRSDVLPTGRNLYAADPRAMPSKAAHAQGIRLAEELLRRHLQDHGDWPRSLVVDLWGSAAMRTAGEEVAMAMHLAGAAPLWAPDSGRVKGFEILPLALLNRPRIDVTLRVSGLFRDVFADLLRLLDQMGRALEAREEASEDNPYAATPGPRVFGPRPGGYGLGMGAALEDYTPEGRKAAGEAWLKGSEWAFEADGAARRARAELEARVRSAEAFAHPQDMAETDLLLAEDYAAHEGGFAAAAGSLGASPALYHLDGSRPEAPRARALTEEIARVVRARAANPDWASGMMNHGFRGAAEIAATLDHLAAFAHLTEAVPAHLFDLYHEATLGRPDLREFLARENPEALAAMRARFRKLREAGLWRSRRNWLAGEESEESWGDS